MRAALLFACVVALVFLIALGSNRSLAGVGGPGHVLGPRLFVGDLALVFLTMAAVVLGGIVHALWGGRRRRRRDDDPEWVVEELPTAWWEKPLVLAMGALPAAGLVAAIVLFALRRDQGRDLTQTVAPISAATVPHRPAQPRSVPAGHGAAPVVHWSLLVGAALLLLIAVATVLVRRRLARVETERAGGSGAGEVQAVIEESLDELEREPDPRRAVIRAYTGMERALARRGLGRRPFEAPFEYLARALAAIQVSRPAGERLTALFQRARFSEHPIDAEMKRQAIAALTAVRDELAEETR